MLRDPVASPTQLPLRPAVPPLRFSLCSHRQTSAPTGGPGAFLPPVPRTGLPRHGDDRASQVPGRPPCPHAPLLDPGGTSAPGLLRRLGAAFRSSATASASTTAPISGLNLTACELAVYASQRGSRRNHARLASGCRPTFAGRMCSPAGSRKKVSKMSSVFYISSSFSRLILAHRAAGAQRGAGDEASDRRPHQAESLAGASEGADPAQARATC